MVIFNLIEQYPKMFRCVLPTGGWPNSGLSSELQFFPVQPAACAEWVCSESVLINLSVFSSQKVKTFRSSFKTLHQSEVCTFDLCHVSRMRLRCFCLLRRAGEGDEGRQGQRTRGGRPRSCLSVLWHVDKQVRPAGQKHELKSVTTFIMTGSVLNWSGTFSKAPWCGLSWQESRRCRRGSVWPVGGAAAYSRSLEGRSRTWRSPDTPGCVSSYTEDYRHDQLQTIKKNSSLCSLHSFRFLFHQSKAL